MSQVNEGKLPCPKCPSSDAYHLYDDGHGFCFSCSYFKPAREDFLEEDFTYEYMPRRGIHRHTFEFYGCLTKIDAQGQPVSVGYKYPDGRVKVRSLSNKEFWWHGSGTDAKDIRDASIGGSLYGRDKFSAGAAKSITITEGEEDAHSLYQVLGSPVVSVQSSVTAARDVVADRSWVDSHERIYLAFDNDGPGKDACKAVARLFDYNKIYVVDFDIKKDANEYLQAGQSDVLRNLWLNAKRYLPEQVVEVRKDNIQELLGEEPKKGVPYPFKTLNDMTHGIRRGESVLITAPEGVGKTELMHAIEYQLLKETDDGIAAIFLEEDKPDHLRALASIELARPTNVSGVGCTRADIAAAVERVIKTDGRLHIYNHFGSDDPDVLLDTIRFLVTCRGVVFVLLDHLGICVSGLRDEKDERRALDYLSTRLAMMIKELNFALIFVSHVNDAGQTRGSRLIAKDCHVRIDATRDIKANSNIINLMVSKNRPPMGKSGPAGSLLFDQYTRRYSEVGHANDNSPVQPAWSVA